jgi:hypothetical protein
MFLTNTCLTSLPKLFSDCRKKLTESMLPSLGRDMNDSQRQKRSVEGYQYQPLVAEIAVTVKSI